MASIVTEETLAAAVEDNFLRDQAYNALDCCVTSEVHEVLTPRLDEDTSRIYRFEHACQKAALAMTLRGIRIDEPRRAAAIDHYEAEEKRAGDEVSALTLDIWDGRELNTGKCKPTGYVLSELEKLAGYTEGQEYKHHNWPRGLDDTDPAKVCKRCGANRWRPSPIMAGSGPQIKHLLYELLGVRVRYNRQNATVSSDREALESIAAEAAIKGDELVLQIAQQVLEAKKAQKQASYARSKVGAFGRMYSTMNVGATETGRWSATKAPDWTGLNIQQISDVLRGMFVADEGLELFYADLEQAESHIVAFDAGDEAYIQAHLTGDVHTQVCRMIYKDMPWTGDLATDKKLAETYFSWDPIHTKRDHMKRVQHGGNMGRSPQGIARQLRIPLKEAQRFFEAMYGREGAFPRIKPRHAAIFEELKRTGMSTSCLGRKRQFFGRTWDEDTLREALGQLEQSPVADILNLSLVRIWEELDTRLNVWDVPQPSQPNKVWLLAQVHDAILGLYRPGDLETLRRVKELMEIPLFLNGHVLTIPVEIMVGPSWKKDEMRKVKL